MGAIWVLIFVVVLGASGVLTVLGFRPVRPLGEFRPDRTAAPRHFIEQPAVVVEAYQAAASRTPGVRLAVAAPDQLYLDCRPSARILSGDFGVGLRLRFLEAPGGTQVLADAQAKTWGPTKLSTLRELERAVRMRAKGFGITERDSLS